MKKGLCIVLSALILALSFSACSKKGDVKPEENGQKVVEVTDTDGNVVTDASGDPVISVVPAKDEKENKDKADKNKDGKNNKDAGKDKGTIGINPDVSKAFNSDSLLDITAADKDLYQEGTTIKKTSLFKTRVQDVMKTGKFTIDMNTTSNGNKSPMKLAFDGDKMYASFNMNGLDAKLLYMDKTAYIILPNLLTVKNVYFKYPDSDGQFSEMFDSFGQISDNQGSYVGSSKVTVDKKTYTCEEYKTEDGTTLKYYFEGNDWKRYECISKEEKMVYEINSFSGNADSKLFSLKGYTELDPALLGGMGF